MPAQYLAITKVAERLDTTERFRRLVSERRIAFVKIDSHVRTSETNIGAHTAPAAPAVRSRHDRRGSRA
ncbi:MULTISPECIES: hypothetical protein [unclassified Kitasatospora]|uniref:hypothetical protein n=1 Tax=unclassified Kitasatospora TaxID=2633591 RepID=UPI00070B7244|nr:MULTISPECIES: hypothetical protein [unclassified Kitasatospora]KQV20968.1 hypothetical protein ASC99_20935 [Kitasatospora sp. Root107]KRB60379.1 hypothetical protein ASE03_12240 [Kitasatospora sp. Root187]